MVAYTKPEVLVIGSPDDAVQTRLVTGSQLESFFDFVRERAIEEHLALLISATRSTVRVGELLLWCNVAASMAVAFRTMEGCLGDWVQGAVTFFIEHAPAPLQGLGSFLTLENGEHRGWFWERTNCCLYDRLPGNVRCADCSRTPSDARRAAYSASLESS